MAHKWARWLDNPCHLGGPQRFEAGGRIRSGPTSGPGGYITPATWGFPTAAKREGEKWPTSGLGGYTTPAAPGVPTSSQQAAQLKVANQRARWLHNPRRLGGPHCSRAEGRKGPTSGLRGYITPAPWGSHRFSAEGRSGPISGPSGYITPGPQGAPPLNNRWQNQRWHTSGPGGYITPAPWPWGGPPLQSKEKN